MLKNFRIRFCSTAGVFFLALVIAYVSFLSFVVIKYSYGTHKHTVFARLTSQCYHKLKEGDAVEALALAKDCSERYNHDDDDFYRRDCMTLTPRAYEMAGEYDLAIAGYIAAKEARFMGKYEDLMLFRARIDYKKGNYELAFCEYCSFFDRFPEFERSLETNQKEPNAFMGKALRERFEISRTIMGEYRPDVKRLSPFTDYVDFRTFMDDEYERLGSPKVFENAINEIRIIDKMRDMFDEMESRNFNYKEIAEERKELREERLLEKKRVKNESNTNKSEGKNKENVQ